MCLYLSVFLLSFSSSFFLSVCQSVCLSVCLSVFLSNYLFIYQFISVSIYLSACPCIDFSELWPTFSVSFFLISYLSSFILFRIFLHFSLDYFIHLSFTDFVFFYHSMAFWFMPYPGRKQRFIRNEKAGYI